MVLTPKPNKMRISPYLTHNTHRKLIEMCAASQRNISDVCEHLIIEGYTLWSKPKEKDRETL